MDLKRVLVEDRWFQGLTGQPVSQKDEFHVQWETLSLKIFHSLKAKAKHML